MDENPTTASFFRSIPTTDAVARCYFMQAADAIDRLSCELAQRKKVNDAGRANIRDARDAMLLIREAVETLAPVGALTASEYIGPTPHEEAVAIIGGIQAIFDAAQRECESV